jgi:hypothetical protein
MPVRQASLIGPTPDIFGALQMVLHLRWIQPGCDGIDEIQREISRDELISVIVSDHSTTNSL